MPTNQSVQLVSNLAASDLDVKRRNAQLSVVRILAINSQGSAIGC